MPLSKEQFWNSAKLQVAFQGFKEHKLPPILSCHDPVTQAVNKTGTRRQLQRLATIHNQKQSKYNETVAIGKQMGKDRVSQ